MTPLTIPVPAGALDDSPPRPVFDLTRGPALRPLPSFAPEPPGPATRFLVSAGWTIAGVTGAVAGGTALAAGYQWVGARVLAVTVSAATAML